MTTLQIEKGPLPASVQVPSSKSYANRALILGSLKKCRTTLHQMPEASDVTQLIFALQKAGVPIRSSGDSVIIENSFPECEAEGGEIITGEGGTTARFLSALLLKGRKPYTLILGKRLKERPWDEFLNLAHSLGAKAKLEGNKLHLQGPVRVPQTLEVDCSRTTQFATAFDLVLAQTEVRPVNLHSSQSYLMMNEPLKEHIRNHDEYTVPADWSSAAYPMVFAALNQQILFPGLRYDPFQADAKLLSVLNDLGAVETTDNGLLVRRLTRPRVVQLDMSDCLDLFPAMAFLLSHVEGRHTLTGLDNLAHKESDRLAEVENLLKTFGRKYSLKGSSIEIEGGNTLAPSADLSLPDDHRIVMTGALYLRHHSGGKISPAESVSKSYPGFFELMRS